ncbi:MAG: 1-acyl-sn-glycerol-3-phosphate acyltransferase [Deltaproteobacteria bacterium]|nr:1-acyl-sn-glycerol-3-phosphate acyltransferase [Deltaproteobacteria bacterium]
MTESGQVEGRIARWFNRKHGEDWGTSPADYDPDAVRRTLAQVRRLFGKGRYFDLKVTGWRNVPQAPAMIVSNHSGGTTVPDIWGFGVSWYRHFGVRRPLHLAAHDFILATAATRAYFGRRGAVRGSRRNAYEVLRHWHRDLMVMPGGDLDTWRPFTERYKVRFGGRRGYARVALRAGVPIVPVAHAGAHETLIVLADGQRLARALRLQELARAHIWPVHLSLPWGLAIGPWPHIPIPTRFRYRIGPPILPPDGPLEDPPEDLVLEHDARVRTSVQLMLDELRADEVER